MLTDEFLDNAELKQLCGAASCRRQGLELDAKGIPWKPGHDGHPLVSRVHVRQWLANQPIEAVRSPVMANIR